MDAPTQLPKALKVSTITAIGSLGSCIRLPELFGRLEVVGGSDGFVSVKYDGDLRTSETTAVSQPSMSSSSGPEACGDPEGTGQAPAPPKRLSFNNQVTLVLAIEGARVNLKVFRNGRVQMTGVKQVSQGMRAMLRVEAALRELDSAYTLELAMSKLWSGDGERGGQAHDDTPPVVEDMARLAAGGYKVCLINSDFDLGFRVKRDLLLRCINAHYPRTACSYEPCLYPGAKIKFMWNDGGAHHVAATEGGRGSRARPDGVCRCSAPCSGKGDGDGDGRCRKVTVSVFQSGKVIITGAHTEAQLVDAYRFLVDDVAAMHGDEFRLAPPKK